MKKEALITAMKSSISDILETMFFLPLDFSDAVNIKELWNLEKDEIMVAGLNFDGPFSGYYAFYIPQKLAVKISADFMGKDKESISDNQVSETIKEIINMIAGNTFSIYDQQAVFNLEIPEMARFSELGANPSDSENQIFIGIKTIEDHLALQMAIRIDD